MLVLRGLPRALLLVLALPTSLGVLSCSPNLRGGTGFELLVFPGEAELGGSATAVISSNYVPGPDGDAHEDYQLERSRVGIVIRNSGGSEFSATVRAVFPLAASAASQLARTRPGVWATVVLFDLPTNPAVGTGPADVIVSIDGDQQLDDRAIGSIRITGTAGHPTTVLWPPITDLELDSIVARLRPVLDQDSVPGGGFPQEPGGTVVSGIEGDLVYFSPCLMDAEAYTGTEATDAGIYLGPENVLGGGGWTFFVYRHFILTSPQGFTLVHPPSGAPAALGEGPLLDFTFDRPNQSIFDCNSFGGLPLWLWNVVAVRPNGMTIVDQRGTGTFGESSDLFALYSIPPP
jgi:hypothetical protein